MTNFCLIDEKKEGFFKMDQKKKQVTLLEPEGKERNEGKSEEDEATKRKVDVSAPNMFACDGLFTDEDGQNELSSSAINDILPTVLAGCEGTLFYFGHTNLGKSYTMIGSDESSRTIGISQQPLHGFSKVSKSGRTRHGPLFESLLARSWVQMRRCAIYWRVLLRGSRRPQVSTQLESVSNI